MPRRDPRLDALADLAAEGLRVVGEACDVAEDVAGDHCDSGTLAGFVESLQDAHEALAGVVLTLDLWKGDGAPCWA